MDEEWYQNPALLVAGGIGLAAVVASLLWGVAQIIPAVLAGIALFGSIVSAGVVAAPGVAAWVIPVAGTGVAVAGATGAVMGIAKVVREAEKQPFRWTVPILGVVAAFLIDLCKEFYPETPLVRILFAAVGAVMVVIAGFLFGQRSLLLRLAAIGLFILPPATVILGILSEGDQKDLLDSLGRISSPTWTALAVLLALCGVIILLARKLEVSQVSEEPRR